MSTERPDDFDDAPMLRPLPPTSGDDGLPERRPRRPPAHASGQAWLRIRTGDRLGTAVLRGDADHCRDRIYHSDFRHRPLSGDSAERLGCRDQLRSSSRPGWRARMVGSRRCVSWSRLSSPACYSAGSSCVRWCGKQWKRKIALTRAPSVTHMVLVVIGFVGLIAPGRRGGSANQSLCPEHPGHPEFARHEYRVSGIGSASRINPAEPLGACDLCGRHHSGDLRGSLLPRVSGLGTVRAVRHLGRRLDDVVSVRLPAPGPAAGTRGDVARGGDSRRLCRHALLVGRYVGPLGEQRHRRRSLQRSAQPRFARTV